MQVGPPLDVGPVPGGRRRIIPILSGTFEGSGMKGRVLPGGADWQIVRADGLGELDTRYTLETDDGKLIYVQNAGHPSRVARSHREADGRASRWIRRWCTSAPFRSSKRRRRNWPG